MALSRFDISELDRSQIFVIEGIDTGDRFGSSISDAGDVNGDGIDDIIISAPGAGKSYVIFGSSDVTANLDLASLDGTNGFSFSSSSSSVSGAGDVNGDGIDDIIIGAPNAYVGNNYLSGETYVVFGSRDGFAANLDRASLDGSNGFIFSGDTFAVAGSSVSGAGDVNGDGIDDIIIGAPEAFFGANGGESFIVFGSSDGFAANLNEASLDGSNGFTFFGGIMYNEAGSSVSNAGDINGDGIDDIIVGAPGGGNSRFYDEGEAYVIFGSNDSFSPFLNPSSLRGNKGFTLVGIDTFDFAGVSVSGAGDVNGDGIDDVIVGAPGVGSDSVFGVRRGEVYVVFGSNDGFASNISLDSLDGTNGFSLSSLDSSSRVGSLVSDVGDVNGDGIDDIIIGAFNLESDSDNSNKGEAYVIFGSSDGFAANLDLANPENFDGFVIASKDDYFSSVSGAGDVDGDGIDDILIGASGAANNAGESYVVFGNAAPTITTTSLVTTPENKISVVDINAKDNKDTEGNGLTYSIAGGVDADLFNIDENTGELIFDTAPDFENPIDANSDNDYLLRVRVNDSAGLIDELNLTVRVSDVSEFNFINGTAGRDRLVGDERDDFITGGRGRDRITTGAGQDVVSYNSILDAGDIITDFEVSKDKLDFGTLLDNIGYSGSDPIEDGYIGIKGGRGASIITLDIDGTVGSARARNFALLQGVNGEELLAADSFDF